MEKSLLLVINACIIIFILLLLARPVETSRAPDLAPTFPEGWCDLRYGSPTKTTGECICKSGAVCDGKYCESSQGFIWYSYAKCPTCKCISKVAVSSAPRVQPPASEGEDGYIIKKNGQRVMYVDEENSEFFEDDKYDPMFIFWICVIVAVTIFFSFLLFLKLSGAMDTPAHKDDDTQSAEPSQIPKESKKINKE